jgi:hypothetical protein
MKAFRFFQNGLSRSIKFPVETISFFVIIASACYLTLILHSYPSGIHTKTYPELQGEKVLLKQIFVSLVDKSHNSGVLNPEIVRKVEKLDNAIQTLYSTRDGIQRYSDLCWKQNSKCVYKSPRSIFTLTTDPIEQVQNQFYTEKVNESILGMKMNEKVLLGADSMVFTLFFNVTTPYQLQSVQIWEKRLEAMNLDGFYNHDLALNFRKVLPDGSTSYDIFNFYEESMELLKVFETN